MTDSKYDDIINVKWTGADGRERMPLISRAKIFMPFSSLKGFPELIKKTQEQAEERLSDHPGTFDEDF
ncbi:MAG: hypothetical protein K5930_11950 [Treponemataceae bacterium]|nr:hypothetical protein [Treponemataceae bacterium]